MKSRSAALAAALILISSACSATIGPQGSDDAATDPPPTPQASPTPAPTEAPTAPPETSTTLPPPPAPSSTPTPPSNEGPVTRPRTFSVEVGHTIPIDTAAYDSDGSIEGATWTDLPPGTTTSPDGRISWQPSDAGTWTGSYRVVDDDGATSTAEAVFVARYSPHPEAMVAMGDSVASGHGLQESDYLGRDGCWRDQGEAYPRQVFETLVESGTLAAATAELALVACSGHDTDDLFETAVTGGLEGTAPEGIDKLTQLDWAVRANPGVVTITIGANDTGFVGPAKLLRADHSLDRNDVARRMDVIRADLRTVLQRLVDATDAGIYVTNYYDPTAIDPQGVEGCRNECFAEKAAEVVGAMNDTIAEVVAEFPERVELVDIHSIFVGHGAPNGLGPDGLRAGGFGLLGSLIGGLVSDVHPYCAHGETIGDPWVNSVDCVHPDGLGTRMLAETVAAAIV